MRKFVAAGQNPSKANTMSKASEPQQTPAASDNATYVLWIDRIGSFLVCLDEHITIGGPAMDSPAADIALLANLSRRHASLIRSGEGYVLEAHCPTSVAGRAVHERINLNDGYEIEFSGSVRLRFRLPTVLSASARLEFLSDHRPVRHIDGIILMADTCLLGPGNENHVQCPCWPGSVLLIHRSGRLSCKSRMDLFVDGRHVPDGGELAPGSIVTGPDLRFYLERIDKGAVSS